MEEKIMSVLRRMQEVINDEQLRTLQSTLNMVFSGCELVENTELRVVDRSWQNTTEGERIMNIIEQARKGREMLEEQADSMTDEEILTAPTFVKHWKANTFYRTGKRLNYNGIIYKVLQDHTLQADWLPANTPSLYTKVLIPDENVIPEWEQPESTNPYMTGDKVTHNGKTWVSDIDNNVWEPSVYGWSEIE